MPKFVVRTPRVLRTLSTSPLSVRLSLIRYLTAAVHDQPSSLSSGDISLPVSNIPDFIERTGALLESAFPGCQVVCFGHLGDGNLHYNVAPPDGVRHDSFLAHQEAVNRIVHDSVAALAGSISAEHGVGALKREELQRYKSAVELDMMRAVKAALDPLGIMNPGKIL